MRHVYFRLRQSNINKFFTRKLNNIENSKLSENQKNTLQLTDEIETLKDRLIYCDAIHRKMYFSHEKNKNNEEHSTALQSLSVALKYISNDNCNIQKQMTTHQNNEIAENTSGPIFMPYQQTDQYSKTEVNYSDDLSKDTIPVLNDKYSNLYELYLNAKKKKLSRRKLSRIRQEIFGNYDSTDTPSKVPQNWMADYEHHNDSMVSDSYFGTPNQKIPVSSIPCGGCGALLHCQDPAIPGYLPSELFINIKKSDLKNTICQRCHFLKYYNTMVEVRVPTEEYPEILSQLKLSTKKALVLLMVDLTDFPCSIWPNLSDIIGRHTPFFVVGNKIDLLPPDCPEFISNVEQSLLEALEKSGIRKKNIQHLALISSKTGYGVEQLITKLQSTWKYEGNVYMIGCTNVGKSTLFNTLLQSDFCMTGATNHFQPATMSPWPGTTLNVLKFPILNPVRWRLYLRMQRRKWEQQQENFSLELRKNQYYNTKDIRFATLQESIGRTFSKITDKNESYKNCRWCYDTPGVVHSNQILHFLTTEELLLTLPKQMIRPRTFLFKPGQTLFLAGLGRVDLLTGPVYIRITVFASDKLPVTICHTVDADSMYDKLLSTGVFIVPANNQERLKLWPKLASKDFSVDGVDDTTSAADVLLSNAGWIAVTPNKNEKVSLRAWTLEGRGIYLRTPAVLPKSVSLRGARINNTATYQPGRQVYVKK
ncbi:nitric oxide-associated protein 1 [Chelonus insularis]|uniref:nitric oxide-associated protein 1 n=1 Tax=Chelonus insularis TaxID=460826 RepID=UPI00158F0EEE|nr:nitric oxide-associated protein 1 [Chelonus insularis]